MTADQLYPIQMISKSLTNLLEVAYIGRVQFLVQKNVGRNKVSRVGFQTRFPHYRGVLTQPT